MPAVAARHDVGAGLTAEVAVLLGVKLPVNEVTVYPRCVGNRVLQGKRLNALGAASGDEVNKPEIPVAAGDHRPDAGLLDRLLRKRRDMVADKYKLNILGQGCGTARGPVHSTRQVFLYPFPMALDDRRLRLEDDEVGMKLGELHVKRLGRKLRGDSIEEENLVPGLLQHRRRRRGDDGEDVGRPGEPLELAVLSEERDALLALQRRIGYRDPHLLQAQD